MANQNNNAHNYVISRWNNDFGCTEFLSTNGVHFTLHLDKTQKYNNIETAARWATGRAVVSPLLAHESHYPTRENGGQMKLPMCR